MEVIKLGPCYIASVRADLVKGEVRIALSVKLEEYVEDAVRYRLAWWSAGDQPVGVTLREYQPELPGMEAADGSD